MPDLLCRCGPMRVVNTSWWGNPFADRLTDVLVATCTTVDSDGQPLTFPLTFPQCVVRRTTDPKTIEWVYTDYADLTPPIPPVHAVWMVAAVVAGNPVAKPGSAGWVTFPGGGEAPLVGRVDVAFPQEPTVRAPDGIIDVLPITGSGMITLPDGRVGDVSLILARTKSRPQGWGLFKYVVDAVDCQGQVTWRV